jgi:hypothetical protein
MAEIDWSQRANRMRMKQEQKIETPELPEIDTESFSHKERFPEPEIHCPDHGDEDHYPTACSIDIAHDIHWSHMGGHHALAWTHGTYSYNDSNRYYIRALISDRAKEWYHAERVMADRDSRAWWIFDRLCEEMGWRILGDTLVLKTRDNEQDYGWSNVHKMDDWEYIDEMITEL